MSILSGIKYDFRGWYLNKVKIKKNPLEAQIEMLVRRLNEDLDKPDEEDIDALSVYELSKYPWDNICDEWAERYKFTNEYDALIDEFGLDVIENLAKLTTDQVNEILDTFYGVRFTYKPDLLVDALYMFRDSLVIYLRRGNEEPLKYILKVAYFRACARDIYEGRTRFVVLDKEK